MRFASLTVHPIGGYPVADSGFNVQNLMKRGTGDYLKIGGEEGKEAELGRRCPVPIPGYRGLSFPVAEQVPQPA